jgi:transposase
MLGYVNNTVHNLNIFSYNKKPSQCQSSNNHQEVAIMHNYCINKLLNLKEVKIKNIIHQDNSVDVFIETKAKIHTCPACSSQTKKVHDYRQQIIKDLPLQMKHCNLVLKKRRYQCKCGKRFYEKYDFLAHYQQCSIRLTKYTVNELRNTTTIKEVARRMYQSLLLLEFLILFTIPVHL